MIFPIDETHNPALTSWVETAQGHPDFPIQNLPYAIFAPHVSDPRPGVAIGDQVLDLRGVAGLGLIDPELVPAVQEATLNALLALPVEVRRRLRTALSAMLSSVQHERALRPLLHPAAACQLGLPAAIGDYTDFYVGIHHATNVGRLFRPDAPLLPNYKHVPIGYHGRASSVRPSGVPLVRPNGQRKAPDAEIPDFGPSRRLDHEVELGIWVAEGNRPGAPVPIAAAPRHIGGFCLLNDWSARDLQAWEYQPLGPFLAKSFHTTVSPWIVTPEALAPFWRAQPPRPEGDPDPLPYLWDDEDQRQGALGLELRASLSSAGMRNAELAPQLLSRAAASNMYWTTAQILTHHTSNGCNLRPGDLLGTGTISGPTREGYGSLLEISRGGAEPIDLPTGETRTFLEDGDEVVLSARASREGFVGVGFGECRAVVLPAPAP
ncbi:fumarylacetoacetase [Altererythrobacter sp. Root672]|uniref:fumarylacetoacetase n=1 Tax=Altererythrobacter sp. Root672 TaxID=1736584 RepID=UPI0006F4F276|nr:fumarylacetoacetase [Altererythrobacter sp. Root672]KRA84215.1 fumarylacetoacetase [Altererythrobacter sp. Root672]